MIENIRYISHWDEERKLLLMNLLYCTQKKNASIIPMRGYTALALMKKEKIIHYFNTNWEGNLSRPLDVLLQLRVINYSSINNLAMGIVK